MSVHRLEQLGLRQQLWATREGSNESGGLKFVYLQKSIILLLVGSLTLQALSDLVKVAYRIAGRLPEPEVKHG